jgi:hypothetical protein
VREAKAEIDSAVSTGDLPRLASVVHDSARIVTPAGDTVSEVAPIAAWLVRDTTLRVARVRLLPRRTEFCSDGLLEWGGNAVVLYTRDGRFETFAEPYKLRWALEPDGTLRAKRLVLGDAGRRPAAVDDCPSRSWVTSREARLSLWIAPPYAAADQSRLPSNLTKQLRRAGYGHGSLSREKRAIDGYYGTSVDDSQMGYLGARLRVRGPFSIELLQPLAKSVARVQGYDPATFSHFTVAHEARYSAAMASYRWGYLRVGAGPYRIASRWHQEETPFQYTADDWRQLGPTISEDWRSTAWGMITQGTIAIPVGGIFAAEGFIQHRGLASGDIPGTEQTGPLSTSVGGLGFGLILGLTF